MLLVNKDKLISKIISFFLITVLAYECIHFIYYKQRITPAIIDSFIESNQLEIIRMLHSGQIIFLISSSVFIGCFLSFIKRIDNFKLFQSLRLLFFTAFVSLIATGMAKIFFIYKTIANIKNYVLYFTSDHGKIVNVGHGLKGAKEQYFIPLMILDKSGNKICGYVRSLRNKDGYINGLMNKYIITKMLGYKLHENTIDTEIENDRVIDAANKILIFKGIENYY